MGGGVSRKVCKVPHGMSCVSTSVLSSLQPGDGVLAGLHGRAAWVTQKNNKLFLNSQCYSFKYQGHSQSVREITVCRSRTAYDCMISEHCASCSIQPFELIR